MKRPGLNVICWKLTRILFRKVAKFYERLYGGGGLSSWKLFLVDHKREMVPGSPRMTENKNYDFKIQKHWATYCSSLRY